MISPLPAKRWDVVEVEWVDIFEDPTGDPDTAAPIHRKTTALFWGTCKHAASGVEILVTTSTRDADGTSQSGYCAYPLACVTNLRVIKRAPRQRKRKAAK